MPTFQLSTHSRALPWALVRPRLSILRHTFRASHIAIPAYQEGPTSVSASHDPATHGGGLADSEFEDRSRVGTPDASHRLLYPTILASQTPLS